MRIAILPIAILLIGATDPDFTEADVAERPVADAVERDFDQSGCAQGTANFNSEVCKPELARSVDCVPRPVPVEDGKAAQPKIRQDYDPVADAPMEMRAVYRLEDGCQVIELTNGKTVPVPEHEDSRVKLIR